MGYYEAPKQSFHHYCIENYIFIQQQQLQYTATKIIVQQLKEDRIPPSFVTEQIALHLNMRKEAALEQQRRNVMANRVLTDEVTALIVSTCRELLVMCLGIDGDTCLDVTNSILCEGITEKVFVPVMRSVVKQIIDKNKDFLTLMKGNSIDPKQVRQANKAVMQELFVKFYCYMKILNNQGWVCGVVQVMYLQIVTQIWMRSQQMHIIFRKR